MGKDAMTDSVQKKQRFFKAQFRGKIGILVALVLSFALVTPFSQPIVAYRLDIDWGGN